MLSSMTLFALTLACRSESLPSDSAGSADLGSSTVQLAAPQDATYSSASTSLSSLNWTSCEGEQGTLSARQDLDLLEGLSVELPAGQLCGLQWVLAEPLMMEGVSEDLGTALGEVPFQMELDIPSVSLEFGWTGSSLEGGRYVLELASPGWFSVRELLQGDPSSLLVDSTHPDVEKLKSQIIVGSGLFLDQDEDGEVGDSERREGPVAQGSHYEGGLDDSEG